MVRGLDRFREHFAAYTDHYILIGGSACDVRFSDKAMSFRATKDLDVILIVEALTDAFVQHFWDFVRVGGYEVAQIDSQRRFYRFLKPKSEEFPVMLELFARRPDILPGGSGLHITDIPTGEDLSSLSAILLDEDYYRFTLANSDVIGGLRVANDISLIVLKAKAFLNNRQRKKDGQSVQEVDVLKHKNDVIRLTATASGSTASTVTDNIRKDIAEFLDIFQTEPDNVKAVLKPLGLSNIGREAIVEQLRRIFGITSSGAGII
jgi:hypothetical protein